MRLLTYLIVLLTCISTATVYAEPVELPLDTNASTFEWTGRKVGGSHNGTVSIQSGSVEMKNGVPVGGDFVIDMTTIKNEDIETDALREKLENHLKSDDFFAVSQHPTAAFVLKSAAPKEQGDNAYMITGDLTVKGITNEITFPATIVEKDGKYTAQADFTIDRARWDVKYNSKSFFDVAALGDKLIYDDIEISLDLVTQ